MEMNRHKMREVAMTSLYQHLLLGKDIRECVYENCESNIEWLHWAKRAMKSVYGYEFQGDSVLIARENLLYDFIDYYKERFRVDPEVKLLKDIANIITWNIWQMDGLKGVVPYSCHDTTGYNEQMSLFETELEEKRLPCPGCEKNDMFHHNGIYCRIYDWNGVKKSIPYISLFKEGKRNG